MKIKITCLVVVFSFLLGCQTTEQKVELTKDYQALLLDSEFPKYKNITIESEEEIFALNDEMREMIAEEVIPVRDLRERAIKLVTQIFETKDIGLSYVSGANLTARQAYQQNIANCLSLTIMAYALANEAKLNVRFQEVNIPEYWVRQGNFNMLTGHINLLISPDENPIRTVVYGKENLVLDFDPFVVKKSFPASLIDKSTVLAMYYNNKGAQALVTSDFSKAYAYLRASLDVDPTFSSAWGNLGLLYRFNEFHQQAENVYRQAINLNNKNLTAMTNLSVLLKQSGQHEEASEIDRTLDRKREKNPYYHAVLADEAFFNGEPEKAIQHFKKAIKLDGKVHEFYFGLAKVYYQLERLEAAQRAMKKAIALNRLPDIENRYNSKLNFLKRVEVTH